MSRRWRAHGAECVVAFSLLACAPQQAQHGKGERSVPSALGALTLPPAAGPFSCEPGSCRQEHPRLPDAGEWRCADGGGSVWCAGGQAAAGVVAGPSDARYRCARRWGKLRSERICIDSQPDVPREQPEMRACAFEQERGIARVCRRGAEPVKARLPANVTPACWLDRDCPSGSCDRGVCRCGENRDCELGSCQQGLCVEASG